jgi:hypothetical protein
MNPDGPFPAREERLTLPSGREVVVLDRIIVSQRGRPGGGLTIRYRSTLPSADVDACLAEAREVIEHQLAFAEECGYSLSVEVCNTQAAAEMREAPERVFHFVLAADGRWEYRTMTSWQGS